MHLRHFWCILFLERTTMRWYACGVIGDAAASAREHGFVAYYAGGVTTIEIRAISRLEAERIAGCFGDVLYILE